MKEFLVYIFVLAIGIGGTILVSYIQGNSAKIKGYIEAYPHLKTFVTGVMCYLEQYWSSIEGSEKFEEAVVELCEFANDRLGIGLTEEEARSICQATYNEAYTLIKSSKEVVNGSTNQ